MCVDMYVILSGKSQTGNKKTSKNKINLPIHGTQGLVFSDEEKTELLVSHLQLTFQPNIEEDECQLVYKSQARARKINSAFPEQTIQSRV